MIRVLGVDPGLAATGIGMVSGEGARVRGFAYGDIRTDSKTATPDRLNRIYERMTEVLRSERPHRMVVEAVFFLPRHPASGLALGKVVGVIELAAARASVPVSEVPVREAKQVLTGNGAADKTQLERAVRRALNLSTPIQPFHASDALALALIGLYRFSSAAVSPPPRRVRAMTREP
jgi:crossover junction endodeoxyribonuclease RuvC